MHFTRINVYLCSKLSGECDVDDITGGWLCKLLEFVVCIYELN